MERDEGLEAELARVARGGAERYHQKNREQGKLFARERLGLLLDAGSFVEDGALANALAGSQVVSESAYSGSYNYHLGSGFTPGWVGGNGGWHNYPKPKRRWSPSIRRMVRLPRGLAASIPTATSSTA